MTKRSYNGLLARGKIDLKEGEKRLGVEMAKAKKKQTLLSEHRAWNRSKKLYSKWLKLVRMVRYHATGGMYLSDTDASRAVRRFNRSAKRIKRLSLDASFIPGHIKANAKLTRGA